MPTAIYIAVADLLAERVGFEPTVPCGTPVFETGTIDHSDTSPFIRQVYHSALLARYLF